jgi:hypothetical protein
VDRDSVVRLKLGGTGKTKQTEGKFGTPLSRRPKSQCLRKTSFFSRPNEENVKAALASQRLELSRDSRG